MALGDTIMELDTIKQEQLVKVRDELISKLKIRLENINTLEARAYDPGEIEKRIRDIEILINLTR